MLIAGRSAIDEKMSVEEDRLEEEREERGTGAVSRSFCGEVRRTLHPNSCPSSAPSIVSTVILGLRGVAVSLSVGKSDMLSVGGMATLGFVLDVPVGVGAADTRVMVSALDLEAVHPLLFPSEVLAED